MENERGVERYLFIGFLIVALAAILVGSGSYSGGVVSYPDFCNSCTDASLACKTREFSQPGRDSFENMCGKDPCLISQQCSLSGTQLPSGFCGDGICDFGEDSINCPKDCPTELASIDEPPPCPVNQCCTYFGMCYGSIEGKPCYWQQFHEGRWCDITK
ncbi:hypothetical protein HY498_03070 [Candidatus Woesearchaeota archaeon]|nr:hypothetical protein [Candidatus Woesearchaeota archaeon]